MNELSHSHDSHTATVPNRLDGIIATGISSVVNTGIPTFFYAGVAGVLQRVAVCGSVWRCVTVYSSVLQCVAVCCGVLQCVAVCCSVLRCVAVCCSVLQCAAVCCSVL